MRALLIGRDHCDDPQAVNKTKLHIDLSRVKTGKNKSARHYPEIISVIRARRHCLILQNSRGDCEFRHASHCMEIGLSVTVRFPIGQCHRENPIVPLVLHAIHIEIASNRIASEMVVCERPDAVLSQTEYVQLIVNQIGQICVRIIALAVHNVRCYASDAVTVGDDAGWYLEATNHLIRVQIYHPNGWLLHLNRIIWIFQSAGVDEPQPIAFVHA